MSKHYIIPIFVPHLGCPHDCVFCNQKRITGLSTDVKSEQVESIIEEHLKTFKEGATIEVAFFGGSFTAIDMDIQSELLKIPYEYKKKGLIHKIRMSTRPDAISHEILINLNKYDVDIIELGIQSLNEEVLYTSGRGHTGDDMYKAVDLIREYGIEPGLQMMVGLPGDDFEKTINTAREFIKLKPYCVRIYPTLVIKDTYLEKMYENGEYEALTVENSLETVTTALMMFKQNNIDVIRVGLQPTENIQLGKDVVAGPFHPSYRQLVESNIVNKALEWELSKLGDLTGKQVEIQSSNRNISYIVGQKGVNKKHLMEKYKFSNIKNMGKDLNDDTILIVLDEMKVEISILSFIDEYLKGVLN